VAASSELIASGGTDEVIRIFSGKKRCDVGSLMQQEGTISWMEFYKDTHLFTGSDDGTICVWDTRNWECLKTLRGHKGPVSCLSVHPSGKILISVSKDKTLRTWNLIKGRCAYITNLKTIAHLVSWTPTGTHFLVAVDDRIDIYNMSQGAVVGNIKFEGGKRISSIAFMSNFLIAVSADSEDVQIYDWRDNNGPSGHLQELHRFKAHDNRIKGLYSVFAKELQPLEAENEYQDLHLFSISSDGKLKVWKMQKGKLQPTLLASVDTTCRPTTFTVMSPKGCNIPEITSSSSIDSKRSAPIDATEKGILGNKKKRNK
jgi:protein MAK11